MKKLWIRTCDECGHKQQAHKPEYGKPLKPSYENSKCRKCHSIALDYGSEFLVAETLEEALELSREDDEDERD